jgi:hypothetical protein
VPAASAFPRRECSLHHAATQSAYQSVMASSIPHGQTIAILLPIFDRL